MYNNYDTGLFLILNQRTDVIQIYIVSLILILVVDMSA